eukprot:8931481-Pyramimonas_sp.AAC.1
MVSLHPPTGCTAPSARNFDYFDTVFNLADNQQTVTSVGTGTIQNASQTIPVHRGIPGLGKAVANTTPATLVNTSATLVDIRQRQQ